jgi:hypothetical protein
MTVWLVTGLLLFEAVQRIITPEKVNGKGECGQGCVYRRGVGLKGEGWGRGAACWCCWLLPGSQLLPQHSCFPAR